MKNKQASELSEMSFDSDTIIPVTKAATALVDTILSAKDQPTIVTQNGYGIGVVMSIELFRKLRNLARAGLDYNEK